MRFSFPALPDYLAADTTGFVPFEYFLPDDLWEAPTDEAPQAIVEDAPTGAVWWTFRERSVEPPAKRQKVYHTSSVRASFPVPGSKRAAEATPASGVWRTDEERSVEPPAKCQKIHHTRESGASGVDASSQTTGGEVALAPADAPSTVGPQMAVAHPQLLRRTHGLRQKLSRARKGRAELRNAQLRHQEALAEQQRDQAKLAQEGQLLREQLAQQQVQLAHLEEQLLAAQQGMQEKDGTIFGMENRIRDLEAERASLDQSAPEMEVDVEETGGVLVEVASGPSLHHPSAEVDMDGEDPADFDAGDLAWWHPLDNYTGAPMALDGGSEEPEGYSDMEYADDEYEPEDVSGHYEPEHATGEYESEHAPHDSLEPLTGGSGSGDEEWEEELEGEWDEWEGGEEEEDQGNYGAEPAQSPDSRGEREAAPSPELDVGWGGEDAPAEPEIFGGEEGADHDLEGEDEGGSNSAEAAEVADASEDLFEGLAMLSLGGPL
ncbi:MAG: hypothetical protein M1839_001452 [Geoglossum umbratile]|nr:MAG: hypothetical protein M1839_001452 [Geoglossum umbratile]